MLLIALATLSAPFISSFAAASAGPSDETLRSGAEVYNEACSACHQPGGAGLVGQFPPLVGNPNIDDADYIETVILSGLSGEIDVNGQIYDSVMPAQSTLGDDDVADVIAYIQSGFAVPAAPDVVISAGDDDSGLPAGLYIALVVALLVGLVAFAPRIVAANDRREIAWTDAWMKTAVVVVGLILATTIIPARVIEADAMQDLSRTTRDLITVGVWGAGFVGALAALWYAHRKRRI